MIHIDDGKTAFLPGETIAGTITLDPEGRAADLRLFWYTAGRGRSDVGVVETRKLEPTPSPEPLSFSFTLPAGPYSVAGKLITLNWAIEAIIQPGSRAERVEFCMSPDSKPIELTALNELPRGL